jgi:hypothetical protein
MDRGPSALGVRAQVLEDFMKRSTLIMATLSQPRTGGGAMAGATLHQLGLPLHARPRAAPFRDDDEPQPGSFSTHLAVEKHPQNPSKLR